MTRTWWTTHRRALHGVKVMETARAKRSGETTRADRVLALLSDGQCRTLREIAEEVGLSVQRVSQIALRAGISPQARRRARGKRGVAA